MQILGAEARARVPEAFVMQDPGAANPPTLFLPLAGMAREVADASPAARRAGDLKEQVDFISTGEAPSDAERAYLL